MNSPPASPPPSSRLHRALGLVALAAAATVLVRVSLHLFTGDGTHGFAGLYDGSLVAPERWRVVAGGWLAWCFDRTQGELEHPALGLRLSSDPSMSGRAATSVHLASAVLHVAACAAAAVLLRALLGAARDRWTSAAAFASIAVWFLHPLRVEPVACAAQQSTIVGGVLLAAAAVMWAQALARPERRTRAFVDSIALLALALAVDPALAFAPLALTALTLWVRRDEAALPAEARRPLTVAWVVAALCLVWAFARREPGGGAPALPSALAAASVLVRPLRATLWPVGLHPGYDAPPGFPAELAPSLWIDAFTAAALVAACIWGVRRRHGLGLALLAYLGLAAGPALLRREPFGADGDAYVATLPLFVAAGVALARATDGVERSRPVVAIAVFAAAAVPVFALTHGRGDAWRDEASLAKSVVDADPTNERAYVAMGDEARRAGAPVADLVHWYATALEYGEWRPLAHARLGAALLETGDTAGARRHLERAVEIAPWLAPARFDLGALELRAGHLDAARTQLVAAARLDAESADAWRLVAQTMDAGGDREGAANAIRRAARLRPDDAAIAEELRRLTK